MQYCFLISQHHFFSSYFNVLLQVSLAITTNKGISETQQHFKAQINPFTPKASLIRYWNAHVSNKNPIPNFLLTKASLLTPQHYATLNKLLTHKPFSPNQFHHSLCSTPNLYCSFDNDTFHDPTTTTTTVEAKNDTNFALYSNKRFANYGSSRTGMHLEECIKNFSL